MRRSPTTSLPRRGVAILTAIGVLAVLTILVAALAASVDSSVRQYKVEASRSQAQSVAWFGLDTAKAMLAKNPAEILGKTRKVPLDGGECEIKAGPAQPNAPYFAAGSAIKPRPGDNEVSISVTLSGKKPVLRHYLYLINVAPGTERVIALPVVKGK